MDWTDDGRWLALGLLGNGFFFSRFLVQWIASERAGRSHIPRVFWHLSLVGSALLLAYALHRADPVFVLAYLPNGFVYWRNLVLLRREGSVDPVLAGPHPRQASDGPGSLVTNPSSSTPRSDVSARGARLA